MANNMLAQRWCIIGCMRKHYIQDMTPDEDWGRERGEGKKGRRKKDERERRGDERCKVSMM